MPFKKIALALTLVSAPAVQATVLLGIHAEEPAPSIGEMLSTMNLDGEPIKLQAFDSSAEVVSALAAGGIDFGIIEDSGISGTDIALVGELYPSVLHVLIPSEFEPPATLGELLSLGNIWAGPPGSLGHSLARNLAADFGINENAITLLPDPWSATPQVYFIFGGLLAREALDRLQGFSLYSLDGPEQLMHGSVAEGVALRYPQLRPFVLPAQLYPSLSGDAALTLAVTNMLAVRSGIEPELSYAMAEVLETYAPQIAQQYPLARLPDPRAAAGLPAPMALHPGAKRYRDRDLPGFLERYAEVLALATSVVIALGSVLVAWQRYRRQSRKDRLDTYYQQLLDQRQSLQEGSSTASQVMQKARAIQSEVMALVIEERIDADSSLIAFLTLSNRLLDEAAALTA
ncbi:MAG: TAXI family TRAP transporter solute-binding subunit [Pseudomonadota bacterium]